MKKLIFSFITSIILASIPISANAATLTVSVEPTGNRWVRNNNDHYCRWVDQTITYEDGLNCSMNTSTLNTTTGLVSIDKRDNIQTTQGYYYQVLVSVKSSSSYSDEAIIWNLFDTENFNLADIEEITNNKMYESTRYYQVNNQIEGTPIEFGSNKMYLITYEAVKTGSVHFRIGNDIWWSFVYLRLNSTNDVGSIQFITYGTIVEFKPTTIDDINRQQEQAGQQAQNDGQQQSNTGQQSAENATQNGFETLGTIIGAFTDTPSGDCTINGNLGNVDLGTLNFCQGNIEPIRPIIRAVIYLVMALGTYKLLMWIIGSIAGLVNYVQTGSEE